MSSGLLERRLPLRCVATGKLRWRPPPLRLCEQRESIGRLLRLVKPAGTVSKHRDKGCSEGCSDSPKGAPASERTA